MMERIRNLTVRDIPEARELWASCFDDSSAFMDWFFQCRYRPEFSLALEIDEKIVCIAHGCPMKVRIRQAILPALMICGVATRTEFRGHGYMHRIMAALVALSRDNDIPVVFHSPAKLNTYFSIGHLPCTDTLRWIAPQDAAVSEPLWSEIPDLTALVDCYNAATLHYSGSTVRSQYDMQLKLDDYRSDGAHCLTAWQHDRLDGYLIACPSEQSGAWTAPEVIARNPAVYQTLLKQLPIGSSAKLPPDLQLPGIIEPQGVMGVASASALLRAVCGDPALTFAVADPLLSSNNGVFDGCGRPVSRAAQYSLSAGELLQMLSGYTGSDSHFPKCVCFCVDEY
ncbi:MAG: GNAT family N-acetyltransferase [Clostridia bacterium]